MIGSTGPAAGLLCPAAVCDDFPVEQPMRSEPTAMGAIEDSGTTPGRPPDPDDDQLNQPPWRFPVPFGRGPAMDTMTGIAAPLLAGFSLALLGVVAQAPDNFRQPGAALLMLTLTTISMVACVQLGFRARSYLYSVDEIASWWPEPRPEFFTRALQKQQAGHFELWLRWSDRARLAYNASVVMLAFGVALVLAPPAGDGGAESAIRWVASALAGIAGLGELGWAAHDRVRTRRRVGHSQPSGGN
jgi:hypothetical protein